MGSEVNHVVLDVLPVLASRVAVHFHDIFLPWDYPHAFLTQLRVYWTEQYLLQAFLALNPDYDVLAALHALGRRFPDEFARLIPSVRDGAAPGAIWLERRVACRFDRTAAAGASPERQLSSPDSLPGGVSLFRGCGGARAGPTNAG